MGTVFLDGLCFFMGGFTFSFLLGRPYWSVLAEKRHAFLPVMAIYLVAASAAAALAASFLSAGGPGAYLIFAVMGGSLLLVGRFTGDELPRLLKMASVCSVTAAFPLSVSYLLCGISPAGQTGGVFPPFSPLVLAPFSLLGVLAHLRFAGPQNPWIIPGAHLGYAAFLVPSAFLAVIALLPAVCDGQLWELILGCLACLVCMCANLFASTVWGLVVGRMRGLEDAGVRNAELRRLAELQAARYKALGEQFAAARAARHDLRHHLSALEQYIRDGDRRRLEEYLSLYRSALPATDALTVCSNPALDSVVQHYLNIAVREGIRVDAVLDVGENAGIPDPDLCVIMGNCLENALEAARDAPADMKYIRIRSEDSPGRLTIVVGNGFSGRLEERDGLFLSRKRAGGLGLGLSSIRAIAEKYDGAAKFEAEGNLFKTSVILFKEVGA